MSKLITDWMSFNNSEGFQSTYRRTENMAEVQIVWTSELFESSSDAITAGLKAAEGDVSHIMPTGLPKADVHTFHPEASLKRLEQNKHYVVVKWRKFIGPIPGWAKELT